MGLAPVPRGLCVHADCQWEDPTATKNKNLAQFILISTGLLVEHSSYF